MAALDVERGADDGAVGLHHRTCEFVAVGDLGRMRQKRLDGHFAGYFACGVAAHAVGDREQRRRDGQAVFVVVAHQSDVGAGTV